MLVTWPVLLAISTANPSVAYPERPLPESIILGGIQVNEPNHEIWAQTLASRGLNTVEVTVYARQSDWDSANLWWEDQEPSVISEIRAAKRAGLRVFLILRLALDHAYHRNRYLWHGQVYPKSPKTLRLWQARYELFALKWAAIAEAEGVDIFALGSEMNSMTTTAQNDPVRKLAEWVLNSDEQQAFRNRLKRWIKTIKPHHLRGHGVDEHMSFDEWLVENNLAQRAWAQAILHRSSPDPERAVAKRRRMLEQGWRDLIHKLKTKYSGPVGYAANFDQYWGLSFWDALDYVGINAYFPLRNFASPATQDTLASGWSKVFSRIEKHLKEADISHHPVIFTELGYTRRVHTTLAPWAMNGVHLLTSGPLDQIYLPQDHQEDLSERALAIRTLKTAAQKSTAKWAGLLYWKLSTEPAHRTQEPFVLVLGQYDPLELELQKLLDR